MLFMYNILASFWFHYRVSVIFFSLRQPFASIFCLCSLFPSRSLFFLCRSSFSISAMLCLYNDFVFSLFVCLFAFDSPQHFNARPTSFDDWNGKHCLLTYLLNRMKQSRERGRKNVSTPYRCFVCLLKSSMAMCRRSGDGV